MTVCVVKVGGIDGERAASRQREGGAREGAVGCLVGVEEPLWTSVQRGTGVATLVSAEDGVVDGNVGPDAE